MMGLLGNQFIFSRERKRFGRQCLFSDRNELLLAVHPSGRLRLKYVLRNPRDNNSQKSKQMALSTVVTENVTLDQHGMYHYEGGWNVKEVNIMDEESTMRYRKKVERDDAWGVEVAHLLRDCMTMSSQNNAINIYKEFFADLDEDLGRGIRMKITARAINMFHDLWYPQRHLSMCDWMPNNPKQFLTTFNNRPSNPNNQANTEFPEWGNENALYLWDINNPIRPVAYYDTNETVALAKLCPKDENFIAGGLHSGKVCLWNTSELGQPKDMCPLEAAHREVTSALCWVHSKSNTEFYSGSLDGSIKYWDTRDMKMSLQDLLLEPYAKDIQNRADSHGVTVLEFEYTIPVRYVMGSDMGCVFVGNRKAATPSETILSHFQIFAGPIRSIVRNPFFVKNFLLVADWRWRIWSEEIKNCPSTLYFYKRNQLTCGTWSTGRCSLFVIGDESGTLEFWDLLMSHRTPIVTVKFKQSITHVSFHPHGHLLTVSLAGGDVVILLIEDDMRTATAKEKALMAALFEREISRGKLLEQREEEIKLKKRNSKLSEVEELRSGEKPPQHVVKYDHKSPEKFVKYIEEDEELRKAIIEFNESIDYVAYKRSKRVSHIERTIFELEPESEDPVPKSE
ncbi:dynein intermediate chain 3, ciliary [Drosophila pseudoobscura]|uniref:Dynein intermediate chain 3, ciliary n=1 Tax=Drosophila pseudoobscura pseudoobscura TaxID=46245 RepID=A0A6I8UWY7_DROPS|nr:dynein intermediate chain 3, ciliary [Drosophila pseudoobscura]